MKIAVIDKALNNFDYSKYFKFDFDKYHLCSKKLSKVLKKDVDININIDEYDYIILVGSEATKQYTKNASVTDHSGYLINEKFIPLINPSMLVFKPEAKPKFERSVEQIEKIISGEAITDLSGEYLGIEDEEEAYGYLLECEEWVEKDKCFALDTETTGLYPRDGYVLGISICAKLRHAAYISADAMSDRVVEKLQDMAYKYKVIFHNSKFDIKMLQYHFNLKFPNYDDTLLQHYLLDETQGTHGLKQLSIKYTKFGDYDKDLAIFKEQYCKQHKILQEDFTYDLIPFDIISVYAAIDTAATLELYNLFNPLIEKNPKLSYVKNNLLIPGTSALIKMEENGIPFDKSRLEFAQKTLDISIEEAKEVLFSFPEVQQLSVVQGSTFNPNSVQQLRVLLFDLLKLKPLDKKTGTGLQSTDAEVLDSLEGQHPIVDAIITVRKLGKIKNTYIDKILPELDFDNCLRTNFNMTSTTSGRLSSSGKFNAQQIPRDEARVKGSIKGSGAFEGWNIVSQDLATAEMYYAAVLSGDKKLQKVFIDKGDFHSSIAKQVFKLSCPVEEVKKLYPAERQAAKAISFGILYGSGPQKVSDTVSKSGAYFSIDDAKDAIKLYFDTFSKLKEWLNSTKHLIETQGYIYTSFGRKRRLKNVFSPDKMIASHEVRSGINATIQSLASDINLLAAVDILDAVEKYGLRARVFMLVHDSIVALVHPEDTEQYCTLLASCTQKDRGFSIPGTPIGIDQSIALDYSFGSFDEKWGEKYAEFIENSIPNLPS
jgi:DNA polymerase I-like protein with 3'-5' exonuclease and polymerase domains